MSLRTCVVDTRNPPALTKRDRQRKCNLALVSPLWKGSTQPLVLAERNGPHAAPGWLEAGGQVEPDTIYSDVSLLSEAHPFPDDKPFVLWSSGNQKLYGLNLASPGCGEMYAEMLVSRTEEWAKAVCIDYFTSTGWLMAEQNGGVLPPWATNAYFEDFDAGLRAIANRIRQLKPDWKVFGYQYHPTRATSALDGPFIEDRYTRNQSLTETRDFVYGIGAARKAQQTAILEMRDLASYSAGMRGIVESTCEQYGWYCSRGRDATAIGSAA